MEDDPQHRAHLVKPPRSVREINNLGTKSTMEYNIRKAYGGGYDQLSLIMSHMMHCGDIYPKPYLIANKRIKPRRGRCRPICSQMAHGWRLEETKVYVGMKARIKHFVLMHLLLPFKV